ncbi:MAG: type II toxin-antitoxin system RelE/ParE family toxin [Chloroflexota bacterium]|nr:type II toxin-antitoxin system RelE/ParE family toxin [Chloroflexota bacterium]MDQ6907305.1 type II toxin-antitoxin system RelE/ParE family toxin [Chloroflexota bacterium]
MGNDDRLLRWVGTSLDDLKEFPSDVQSRMGFALRTAQEGGRDPDAMPLQGFGGAGVIEIAERFDGNAYRTMYTVRLRHAVYVLHAFQKKSTHGIATPAREMNTVRRRLREAELLDAAETARQQNRGETT